MIMKKKLIFAAIAITALASCSSNDFVGDESPQTSNETVGAISFNYQIQNMTRGESDHATSATNLGNQFIVWGEKSSGASDTKDAPATGHIVFPNYQVNYTASTAYNTTSNTKDWEYVGYTHSDNYQSNITYKASASSAVSGSSSAQTIKYWDYAAGSYTFTAVSASKLDGSSKTDIENGYVKIQKNIDDDNKAANKGYTITVTANADLSKLYFSDRTVITQGTGTDRTAVNAYGGNVTLKFRNVLSQIRAGVYETIPGYAISDIKFYVNTSDDSPTQTQLAQVESTDAFGAICPNIKGTGYAGALTVTYSEATETLNQPMVSANGTVNNNLILGTNISTVSTSNALGTTATNPTWDTSTGTYTPVLLQGAHTTNLKLKCDYTLYNSVSGETIEITGATAEVPYQYLQWKPNYKYSYLFKITDEKLYPITFDAIEVTNSDGLAEYITIVNEPSITTFGVKSGVYSTEKDEYESGTDVYATIMEGSSVVTPVLGTNVNIYKNITSSDATNFPVTEKSLAEAIAGSGAAEKITYALDNSTFASVKSGSGTGNGIPGEDGNEITGVPAIKLANLAEGTYAIEYYKAAVDAVYTAISGTITSGTKYYTESGGVYTEHTADADFAATGSEYELTTPASPAVKAYKVIKVAAAS